MKQKKGYQAEEVEEKWRKYWEKEKIYKFDEKSKKQIYSIDTPPPYASAGHLHVGHALHYTQFEIIARIMRILGKNVYFPPGYDDNGLPTEKYVEEKLGINKSKTSREEFRKICLKESKKVEEDYTEKVFKKLGHSYDWDLLYQTISPEAQKLSQTIFLKLVKKGDCYRSKEPVIWCTKHETALAQAEVEDLTRQTTLHYIDFDVSDGGKVNIATTRPEFLSACVGIFINPKDKKNKKLIGKKIKIPIFNHEVDVFTDPEVEEGFGTGIMMVCTFGDTADIEKWKKHKLALKVILDEKGKMLNSGKYNGLNLEEARKKIVEELKKQGRLTKQEKLEQTVGSCWRCNTPVEYLVQKQWFIKTLKYKKELIKRAKQVNWYPKFMRVRFDNWVRGLGWDWCISRQRYYGIPIPVWYCECGETIFPKEKELPLDPMTIKKKCPKCGKKAKADEDVFDTWMTSSNSPELASKFISNPELYKKIAPMSLRPQSHDIIRTWAFYTILKSHLLFNRVPWNDITIGTFVLDEKGKGMSKSKGNVVWADDLMEGYSVDALRYWVGTASLGSDLPFKEQELVAGKKFITKLYNASKFSLIHLKDYKLKKTKLEKIDEYFLNELAKTIKEVRENFLNYNISKSKSIIENYFWNMFCDNYLEIIKDRIYNNKKGSDSAKYVLYESLLAIIKMFSPICPFITEEIYSWKFNKDEKNKSIHISEFPEIKNKQDKKLKESGDLFLDLLFKVRKIKSEKGKSVKAEIILYLDKGQMKKLGGMLEDLASVCNAKLKEGKFKVEFV